MTASGRSWGARLWEVSWRCAFGVVLGLVAALGQMELRSRGVMSLMLLPYPAVLLAVGMGGLVAGVAAVFAAALALAYVLEPTGSFLIAAQRDALDLGLFCAIGLVIVVLSDRRKRALAFAQAAHARAEEAAASKEAMMAVIAHDLRNPLQTVSLTAELLASRLETDTRALGMLERMRRSVQRAVLLVDAAVERAAEPGGDLLRVRKASCPLSELVNDVVAQYEPLAAARGITLRTPPSEVLDEKVWCDKERMLQILGNLIGNALKFTPAGGIVTLDIRISAEGTHVAVSDTGRGMTEDELTRCFDRLWHGSGPGYGSGLGLWIARTLVEAHGGRLSAASRIGDGTTMSFDLPPEPAVEAAEMGGRRLVPKPAM